MSTIKTAETTHHALAISKLYNEARGMEAKKALWDLVNNDPAMALDVMVQVNSNYSTAGKPGVQKRVPLSDSDMNGMRQMIYTIAGKENNPEEIDSKLVSATHSLFERTLATDPKAHADVGTLRGGNTSSQAQERNLEAIRGSQPALVIELFGYLKPQSQMNLADTLLSWGEANTGSLPSYFVNELSFHYDAGHRRMRDAEIATVVAEAVVVGRVRPESSPRAQARQRHHG